MRIKTADGITMTNSVDSDQTAPIAVSAESVPLAQIFLSKVLRIYTVFKPEEMDMEDPYGPALLTEHKVAILV